MGDKEGGRFSSFLCFKDEPIALSAQRHRWLEEESTGKVTLVSATASVFTASPYPYLSLQVITPFRRLILCAENRKEMEDWISSLKSVQSREHYEVRAFQINTLTDP